MMRADCAGCSAYRIPCFDKPSFEPYLIVQGDAPHTPRFDERFVGYGKNKVQWVQALKAEGFSFWVLPRGFVTHVPHAQTRSGRQWSTNTGGHKQRMDELFDAQMADERKREASLPEQAARGAACTRTPTCKVPLVQFIVDPLDPSNAGRRAPAEILA